MSDGAAAFAGVAATTAAVLYTGGPSRRPETERAGRVSTGSWFRSRGVLARPPLFLPFLSNVIGGESGVEVLGMLTRTDVSAEKIGRIFHGGTAVYLDKKKVIVLEIFYPHDLLFCLLVYIQMC